MDIDSDEERNREREEEREGMNYERATGADPKGLLQFQGDLTPGRNHASPTLRGRVQIYDAESKGVVEEHPTTVV